MKDESARTSTFVEGVRDALAAAGLRGAVKITHTPESGPFGDTQVIFQFGRFLLKFVRDRLQVFVDLASISSPTEFHQFDEVEIAMGWKTIDQVLAKREPEELSSVLGRLKEHLEALKDAFSNERELLTRARVLRAARERGQAFAARLRGGT
jgi:hypothetical protein